MAPPDMAEAEARVRVLMAKVGITRIADVTGLDHVGIPVAIGIRPRGKHLSTSLGKGLTKWQAWISAAMEAMEGHHMENAVEPVMSGSYEELRDRVELLDPSEFSGTFRCAGLRQRALPWAEAHALDTGQRVLIPHALTCLDSTVLRPGHLYFDVSTNGLAAGFTREQALCHAIREAVERDAIAAWSCLERTARIESQVRAATVAGTSAEVMRCLRDAGLDARIWCCSEHPLVTLRCALFERRTLRRLGVAYGSGCHESKDVALTKALLEAAQDRVVVIAGNRDDLLPDFYRKLTPAEQLPSAGEGHLDWASIATQDEPVEHGEALLRMRDGLRAVNRHLFWFDHTKEDLGLPVVQVFCPDLRYTVRRF